MLKLKQVIYYSNEITIILSSMEKEIIAGCNLVMFVTIKVTNLPCLWYGRGDLLGGWMLAQMNTNGFCSSSRAHDFWNLIKK
jgi:hypothetical protein